MRENVGIVLIAGESVSFSDSAELNRFAGKVNKKMGKSQLDLKSAIRLASDRDRFVIPEPVGQKVVDLLKGKFKYEPPVGRGLFETLDDLGKCATLEARFGIEGREVSTEYGRYKNIIGGNITLGNFVDVCYAAVLESKCLEMDERGNTHPLSYIIRECITDTLLAVSYGKVNEFIGSTLTVPQFLRQVEGNASETIALLGCKSRITTQPPNRQNMHINDWLIPVAASVAAA